MVFLTHHISALIKNVCFDTLESHPLDRDLLLSSSLTFLLAVVVGAVHVFCQSEISYFNNAIFVNPKQKEDPCLFFNPVVLTLNYYLHAIPGSQVTMNKLVASKVSHPIRYLVAYS